MHSLLPFPKILFVRNCRHETSCRDRLALQCDRTRVKKMLLFEPMLRRKPRGLKKNQRVQKLPKNGTLKAPILAIEYLLLGRSSKLSINITNSVSILTVLLSTSFGFDRDLDLLSNSQCRINFRLRKKTAPTLSGQIPLLCPGSSAASALP